MISYILAAVLVAADFFTKKLAVAALKSGNVVHVLGNVLTFEYVENRGAAFGMLRDKQWFFIVITIAVIVGLILYQRKQKRDLLTNIAIGLILAGAVGNLIDRATVGYVVDFIRVDLVKFYDFPVFNVADICVTCGCAALLVALILRDRKERRDDGSSGK